MFDIIISLENIGSQRMTSIWSARNLKVKWVTTWSIPDFLHTMRLHFIHWDTSLMYDFDLVTLNKLKIFLPFLTCNFYSTFIIIIIVIHYLVLLVFFPIQANWKYQEIWVFLLSSTLFDNPILTKSLGNVT